MQCVENEERVAQNKDIAPLDHQMLIELTLLARNKEGRYRNVWRVCWAETS